MIGGLSTKALVGAYYETVYNGRSAEAAREFLAEGFVSAGPGGSMDLPQHLRALGATFAAIPDLVLVVEEQVAEGDAVVTRWTVTGTHRGPLFGIPASGRSITATAVHIHHVRDGRITDQWEQFDAFGVLRQLGVLPG